MTNMKIPETNIIMSSTHKSQINWNFTFNPNERYCDYNSRVEYGHGQLVWPWPIRKGRPLNILDHLILLSHVLSRQGYKKFCTYT